MRCSVCNKVAYQAYNGQAYCMAHHPQAVCPRCGRQTGRFHSPGQWCDDCQAEHLARQLPLPIVVPPLPDEERARKMWMYYNA